jgi:hypothetical protein
MNLRLILAAAVVIAGFQLAAGAATAGAAGVTPRTGAQLIGSIQFPRPQGMTLQVDRVDPSRLTAALGFDGNCRGGGIGEVWVAFVKARETVRVVNGAFDARLTGSQPNLGGVAGRTGAFSWRLTGRFSDRDTATATVSGSAEVRSGGRVISRCKIAKPGTVRLIRNSGR